MTVQCSGGGVNGMNGVGRQGLAWSGMAVMGTVRCLPDIVAGTFRSRLSVARSCCGFYWKHQHCAQHLIENNKVVVLVERTFQKAVLKTYFST